MIVGVVEIALAHYRRQKALARRAAQDIARLWARVDRQSIGPSWAASIPAAMTIMSSAQALAVASSGPYLDDILDTQGIDPSSVGRINLNGFAGIASDGRDLESLLYQPAITALTAISRGATVPRALAVGRLELDMIARTQVADAGRVADGVALTARPAVTGYVRLLSPPSCSRCVILAGKRYRWNAGFQRHPRCDCRHIPAAEDAAGDLRTDPKAYFHGLPQEEQDRVFTKAGAQAVRDGADISQVVNARRGMYTAAGRKFTSQGATRRGLAGKRLGAKRGSQAARLMPEEIYREAKGDRDEALRLLRFHGYIL